MTVSLRLGRCRVRSGDLWTTGPPHLLKKPTFISQTNHHISLMSHHISLMSHHISLMSHHISLMSHHISLMSHCISLMSHHISLKSRNIFSLLALPAASSVILLLWLLEPTPIFPLDKYVKFNRWGLFQLGKYCKVFSPGSGNLSSYSPPGPRNSWPLNS